MKKLRILLSCILIFSLATLSTIHITNDIHKAQAASSAYLNDKSLTLELGHYKTLRVKGTSSRPTWYSSNSKVATVSTSGRVVARGYGSTTIVAKVAGIKLTSKVTVVQINKKSLTMAPGSSSTLTLWGTTNKVAWSTSNSKVATVSDTGKVTAKAVGIAKITATVDGRAITSTVTVADLSQKSLVMEVGGWSGSVKTLKLTGVSGDITWSSSDEGIATVSKTGRVTARGYGSATITALVNGTKFTAKVKVLQMSDNEITLKKGDTFTLDVLGTDSKIIWKSYKRSVATISADGTVTANAEGKATIVGIVDDRIVRSKVTVIK